MGGGHVAPEVHCPKISPEFRNIAFSLIFGLMVVYIVTARLLHMKHVNFL